MAAKKPKCWKCGTAFDKDLLRDIWQRAGQAFAFRVRCQTPTDAGPCGAINDVAASYKVDFTASKPE